MGQEVYPGGQPGISILATSSTGIDLKSNCQGFLKAELRLLALRFVKVPPTNLRAQLVRNCAYDRTRSNPSCRNEGNRTTPGVVYNMLCNKFGKLYIGEKLDP